VLGYDIFSVGYTDRITPKSNAGTLVYKPGTGAAKTYTHNEELYRDYHAIRREKGLE